jgi:hypothetical protein
MSKPIKSENFIKFLYTVGIVIVIITVYNSFISKERLSHRNNNYLNQYMGLIGNLVPWKDRIDLQRIIINPYDELPKTDTKFRYLRL